MKPVRIVIFAKAPLPGYAKTRLIPALGSTGAAQLAGKLLSHTVAQAVEACVGDVELCVTPSVREPIWQDLSLPKSIIWTEQGDGDLGTRLARAAKRVIDDNSAVLIIGTDCPELGAVQLRSAVIALQEHDASMVPVSDGGYALIGLNRYLGTVFTDMPWSTERVASLTEARLLAAGLKLKLLPCLHDIDEPHDLQWLPAAMRSN